MFTFCPSTYKVATDTSMATVNWTEPEVHDNVGIKRLVSSHSSGSQLEAGEYLVNYTAEDYAGNHAHCVFMAFVLHGKLTCLIYLSYLFTPGKVWKCRIRSENC